MLTAIGLWHAPITLAEKGFYSMAYMLSLFAAITVQKNTRDSVGDPSRYLTTVRDEGLTRTGGL